MLGYILATTGDVTKAGKAVGLALGVGLGAGVWSLISPVGVRLVGSFASATSLICFPHHQEIFVRAGSHNVVE